MRMRGSSVSGACPKVRLESQEVLASFQVRQLYASATQTCRSAASINGLCCLFLIVSDSSFLYVMLIQKENAVKLTELFCLFS